MSRAHRLSMSKVWLAFECLYGFRMDVPSFPRPPGQPARIGSMFHKLAECHVKGKPTPLPQSDDSLDVLAEALAIFNGPVRSFLNSRNWTACEIGLAYLADDDRCVAGPRRGDPGYEDGGQMVLRGTLDLVHVDGDEAFVADLKTGREPEDSSQLYAQAVAVSRFYGVSRVKVAYARALKTKHELVAEETLDADRLDEEAGRIARALRMLPTSQPIKGAHCWRCDSRPGCPAWAEEAA